MTNLHKQLQSIQVRPQSIQEKALIIVELYLVGYYSHEQALSSMDMILSRVRRDS